MGLKKKWQERDWQGDLQELLSGLPALKKTLKNSQKHSNPKLTVIIIVI
jgi:hypothetical protein